MEWAVVLMVDSKDYKSIPIGVYVSENLVKAEQAAREGAENHARNFKYATVVPAQKYEDIQIEPLVWEVSKQYYDTQATTEHFNYYIRSIEAQTPMLHQK